MTTREDIQRLASTLADDPSDAGAQREMLTTLARCHRLPQVMCIAPSTAAFSVAEAEHVTEILSDSGLRAIFVHDDDVDGLEIWCGDQRAYPPEAAGAARRTDRLVHAAERVFRALSPDDHGECRRLLCEDLDGIVNLLERAFELSDGVEWRICADLALSPSDIDQVVDALAFPTAAGGGQ